MIDEIVLESILNMSDEEFSEALEALSDDEIDSLCEALEGLSSADKKSLKALGRGIGAGSTKGSPEQDRNHEAVYSAAMNKINAYDGEDKTKALKALRKGVKKGIGGNIFTRGKRADALISNMQNSVNFHKEQDKTKELNEQLQKKLNSINSPAKEEIDMFNYDAETIEALESILSTLAEMDETEIDTVTESLDADERAFLNQYIDDREEAFAVETVINALIGMDDEEYASAIESFEDGELEYLSACGSFIDNVNNFHSRNVATESLRDMIARQKIKAAENKQVKQLNASANHAAKLLKGEKNIDKLAKVSDVLNKDVGTMAGNALFRAKKRLTNM